VHPDDGHPEDQGERSDSRRLLLVQHFRRHIGVRARDAEVDGPFVGHGKKPADPAGDGVLGHHRIGQAPQLIQARLFVGNPEFAGEDTKALVVVLT